MKKLFLEKNIELATTAYNIKINFTVLSHISNKGFKVLYTINNSKWNRLDAENRNLILSALSPNNYEIKLKIDDKSNKTIETINFITEKPFGLNPIIYVRLPFSLLFFSIASKNSKFRKYKRSTNRI